MKTCTRCRGSLSPAAFGPCKRSADGLHSWCSACRAAAERARRAAKGAEINAKARTNRNVELEAWRGMKRRCYDPKRKDFVHYGARGIRVCERWLNSFDDFLADVGPRPGRGLSLDRIDVNGNYEPGNVRWATQTEQTRNLRTRNRIITVDGVSMCLAAWAEKTGFSPILIHQRIGMLGWSPKDAVTVPVGARRGKAAA